MSEEPTIGLRIKEVLATYLKRDPATIKSEHTLRDDLGLDSLMTFELLYDLENAFDLEIPNEDLPGLTTIGEVTAYIEARVNPKHASIPDKKRTIPQHPKSQPSAAHGVLQGFGISCRCTFTRGAGLAGGNGV